MSLYDFYMYLKYIEFSSENLEFYIWFKNYEESYNKGLASRYDKDTDGLVKTTSESGSVSSSVFKKSHYHPSDGEGDEYSEKGKSSDMSTNMILHTVHSAAVPAGSLVSNSNKQQPQQREIPSTASLC